MDHAGPRARLTELEALRDIHEVLRLCAAGRLSCSAKTSRPSAAAVLAVAETLVDGDFHPAEAIAAFAWPLLLQAGGLATLTGGKLQLTAKGRRARESPPELAIRQMWQRWPTHAPIYECSRIEQIKGQRAARTC